MSQQNSYEKRVGFLTLPVTNIQNNTKGVITLPKDCDGRFIIGIADSDGKEVPLVNPTDVGISAAYNKTAKTVTFTNKTTGPSIGTPVAGIAATKAKAYIDLADSKVGTDPTGLANDTTAYKINVTLDEGTPTAVSVVGSAVQTYTELVAEILADLTGYTVALDGDQILIQYETAGAHSIVITDGTGEGLIASLTDSSIGTPVDGVAATKAYVSVDFADGITGSSETGLENDTTEYHLTCTLDGGEPTDVVVVGSAAQTYTNLVAKIAEDLTGFNVTLVSDDIKIEYDTAGAHTIVLADGTEDGLLSAMISEGAAFTGTLKVLCLA